MDTAMAPDQNPRSKKMTAFNTTPEGTSCISGGDTWERTMRMRAYVQYLSANGEWANTEKMSLDQARTRCANMDPQQEAFVRVCN